MRRNPDSVRNVRGNGTRLAAFSVPFCLFLSVSVSSAQHDKRMARMSMSERNSLSKLVTLSAQSLEEVAAATTPEKMEARIRGIQEAVDSLAITTRAVDADGRAAIHRYILEEIERLAPRGVKHIGSLKGSIAVPVSTDRLLDERKREPAATVTVGTQSWRVLPFWPNGPLPTVCPKEGLSGALVFVSAGQWEDVKGLDLEGAVALMSFEGGRSWNRLFMLGAKAVIAVEDDHVNRLNAAGLYASTPLPFPRFYVDREIGAELRELATRKAFREDGTHMVIRGKECTLSGGNIYENRPIESIFAYLPPTPPIKYEVTENDLIERIALQHGVGSEDLLVENALLSPAVAAGKKLDIPNRLDPYTVKKRDLLLRLSQEFAFGTNSFAKLNGPAAMDLKPGMTVSIPNVNDTLVIMCRIDSVCSVPDAPHGAKVAGDLAAALTILEHLATGENVRRRKGVLFAFIDGDNYGGRASRSFAEYVLRGEGELKSSVSEIAEAGSGMYRFLTILVCTAMGVAVGLVLARIVKRKLHDENDEVRRAAWIPRTIATCFCILGPVVGMFVPTRDPGGAAESSAGLSTEEMRIVRYEEAIRWLEAPDGPLPSSDTCRWLAEDWLANRLDKQRILLVEERIPIQNAGDASDDPAEKKKLYAELKVLEAEIDLLARDIRDKTFGNIRNSWEGRLTSFRETVEEPAMAERLTKYGLRIPTLLESLREEHREEVDLQKETANNAKVVKDVIAILHPDPADPDKRAARPVTGWLLNLGDGSRTITSVDDRGGRHVTVPGGSEGKALDPMFYNVAAYAAVNGGWPEAWTYFGALSDPDFTRLRLTVNTPIYGEFLYPGKISVALISSVNDRRMDLDTPRDIIENTNFKNLAVQARTALLFMKVRTESFSAGSGGERVAVRRFGRVVGSTRRFNIRSGIDAQDPVPRSYVYYPAVKSNGTGSDTAYNAMAAAGARHGIVIISQLNGSYALPVESQEFAKRGALNHVYAYRFDRETALFDMVVDQAAIGTKKEKPKFKLLLGRDKEKNLILTSVYPRTIFTGVDPMNYRGIPDARAKSADSIKVIDAILNGPPRHYAIDDPVIHYAESGLSATVVYVPKGRKARVRAVDKGVTKALLSGKFVEENDTKGAGYEIGPTEEGDRNLGLYMTPLRIAEDLQQIAEKRREQYHGYGIRDQALENAVNRSRSKLELARRLADDRNWRGAIGAARECWGIVIKNYPSIMGLGRQAVFSVVFLMALLVPAATFLERLVIGSKTVLSRLIGATVIFCLATAFLNWCHPAFEIAVSPFIVMIAFVMILMSAFVLGLCYQRFDVLVRRARIAGGEVESEEISLASSLATAFSLGVSNLKKRPARTALTAFTVSVLTFSIITFVSVKGHDAVLERELALDDKVEGVTVAPIPPRHEGVMFRGAAWQTLSDGMVSAVKTEYGSSYDLVVRGHYMQSEGGNNAAREGVNQIEVALGRDSAIINGIMVLSPEEKDFSALHEAVGRQQWFEAEDKKAGKAGHRFHIILADDTAEHLGIEESDLSVDGRLRPEEELPVVRMMNYEWRVIGILDTRKADRIRCVNGKSVALVDYLTSGITPNAAGKLENEGDHRHMSWRRLAIVPAAARKDVNGKWKSIVVKFKPGDDVEGFLGDISLRRNDAAFSHIDGKVSLLTTKKQRSVGGLAKIVVPIILCILIVANTMMGTVDERKAEVEMLGAVGLSPGQISMLLLSEATVFSVLGIVIGMLGGLAFSKIMLNYPDVLGGLSFNFTSLASTGLAMSTGLIVLIATLIPAKKAAAVAAPSGMEKWELPEPDDDGTILFNLPFTLTRGNAVGMVAFFRRFMLNHTEATSLDFNCRGIETSLRGEPDDALVLTGHMWLAPYDLDVAQLLTLEVFPTENEGVFRVGIRLGRTSGTEESWLRTNYSFMDLVRRQFLLWRNMTSDLRMKYIQEGAALLGAKQRGAGGMEQGAEK